VEHVFLTVVVLAHPLEDGLQPLFVLGLQLILPADGDGA